ncbi:hypothetical protein XHC_2054 [Xanthomonas hortorum pv. carotae str. M081]|nr:hypothetical protein XHC_2054 [Xanthomonas hortorum pv. carotae str. M081]
MTPRVRDDAGACMAPGSSRNTAPMRSIFDDPQRAAPSASVQRLAAAHAQAVH